MDLFSELTLDVNSEEEDEFESAGESMEPRDGLDQGSENASLTKQPQPG